MPPLDSAAQQENWDEVDDGENYAAGKRRGGNNDNIESILPLPIHPFSPQPMSVKNSAHLLAPFKLDVLQKNREQKVKL